MSDGVADGWQQDGMGGRTCQRRCGLVWRWMSEVMKWEKLLRVDFATLKWGWPGWPERLRGACLLSPLGERGQRGDITMRSLDRHVTPGRYLRCLCSCYVFIFTSPPRTCAALLSKMSVLWSSPQSARPRWPIITQPHQRSGDSISHDPTSTGQQRR